MLPAVMGKMSKKISTSDSALYTQDHGNSISTDGRAAPEHNVDSVYTDPHCQANIKPSRCEQRMQGCAGAMVNKLPCRDPSKCKLLRLDLEMLGVRAAYFGAIRSVILCEPWHVGHQTDKAMHPKIHACYSSRS